MKCSFCGKELERGTQECPYCHCSIEAEVQVKKEIPLMALLLSRMVMQKEEPA